MLIVRVSIALGKSIPWVLRRSQPEWLLYLAFYEHEPFGPRQDDHRAASIVQSHFAAMAGTTVNLDGVFPSLRPPLGQSKNSGSAAFRCYAISRCPAFTPMR